MSKLRSQSLFSLINILRFSSFCVFLGRGWQHVFWDAPYRTILWDESLLKPIVESLFKTNWSDYVTSPTVDLYIQSWIVGTGYFYFACAMACLFITQRSRLMPALLIMGSFSLSILALLTFKEHFFQVGQLFEQSLQVFSPIFLLLIIFRPNLKHHLVKLMTVCLVLTFIGHGLYAIGYYPTPGYFYTMIINITHMSEPQALVFLKIAGALDFLVCALLFIPSTHRLALIYMCLWGFATAAARVMSGVQPEDFLASLHQYWFLSFYRLPHGLIPLSLLLNEVKGYYEGDRHQITKLKSQ